MRTSKDVNERIEAVAADFIILSKGIAHLKEKKITEADSLAFDQHLAAMYASLHKMQAFVSGGLDEVESSTMLDFIATSEQYVEDAISWIRSHPLYD